MVPWSQFHFYAKKLQTERYEKPIVIELIRFQKTINRMPLDNAVMLSIKKVKNLLHASIMKWLFPDFTNKLTWIVVTTGCAIFFTPLPFKLLFYNWLVSACNINAGVQFTLHDLSNDNADYMWGGVLVVVALIHNIGYKYLLHASSVKEEKVYERQREADIQLFKQFLSALPSNSTSIRLLKEHDFGNSYQGGCTESLEIFVNEWNNAEYRFLDAVIESNRGELWDRCNKFLNVLSLGTGPIGSGQLFSAVPDMYRDDWNMPEFVLKRIKDLNDKATECYKYHQSFIAHCKARLKC